MRGSKEFSEQKFGAHMSAFIMHQNHMREIAEMDGSERVTKVISQMNQKSNMRKTRAFQL